MQPPRISRRWPGDSCVVAATGPSLTPEVAKLVGRAPRIIAVNDAYRLLPTADVLYACDAAWWSIHSGCPEFAGEKWSSHSFGSATRENDKREIAERYRVHLVAGANAEGFSLDQERIHYGSNSGFQAVNLAILFGATRILLVGFDMRVNGKRHFFGDHPAGLLNSVDYTRFIPHFERAAKRLPPGVEIINCTPQSALRCFRMMDLADALSDAS